MKKIMLKTISKKVVVLGVIGSFFGFYGSADAVVSISSRMHTKPSPKIDTTLPDNSAFRLAGSKNTDIEYWKQALDSRDRNANKYIVAPANGLVVPVNIVPEGTKDYKSMTSGVAIDVNKYLKDGVMQYPGLGRAGLGNKGNTVIFGHSSYWKHDDGRYKTHFGKIIELEVGEEVWVYEKNAQGKYNRYVYKIKQSYNTPASDTSILKSGSKKEVTLFTCTPIGGIAGRWIIKGEYVEPATPVQKVEKVATPTEPTFSNVSYKHKTVIRNALTQISTRADGKEFLTTINGRIDVLLKKQDYRKYHPLLRFMKYEIEKRLK